MNRKKVLFLSCLSFLLLVSGARAQEDRYYALIITKMTESVNWASGNDNLVIGVAGTSEVYNYLQDFVKLKSNLSLIKLNGPNDATQCNTVFVASEAESQLGNYVSTIGSEPKLLICENRKQVGSGPDVGLYLESGKLQFLIDTNSLESKNIEMSSILLAKAKTL